MGTVSHCNFGSSTNVSTGNGINMNGKMRETSLCESIGLRENTITKVKRYNASGSTQSRGIGARFVVMCAVVPSIKLEGTKAAAAQYMRFFALGAYRLDWMSLAVLLSILLVSVGAKGFVIQTRHAHININPMSPDSSEPRFHFAQAL